MNKFKFVSDPLEEGKSSKGGRHENSPTTPRPDTKPVGQKCGIEIPVEEYEYLLQEIATLRLRNAALIELLTKEN